MPPSFESARLARLAGHSIRPRLHPTLPSSSSRLPIRLAHSSPPLSSSTKKPCPRTAETETQRRIREQEDRLRQREVIAAAVSAAAKAKVERAAAERVLAEQARARQLEAIEEARAANRALDSSAFARPAQPDFVIGSVRSALREPRRAVPGRRAVEERIEDGEDQHAAAARAEDRLRRANGGLPDFPPPGSGSGKAEEDAIQKWFSRIIGFIVVTEGLGWLLRKVVKEELPDAKEGPSQKVEQSRQRSAETTQNMRQQSPEHLGEWQEDEGRASAAREQLAAERAEPRGTDGSGGEAAMADWTDVKRG